jgi:hypothetical protein
MSNKVPLYSLINNKIENVSLNTATKDMYYLQYRIPTETELQSSKFNTTVDEIKQKVSRDDSYTPLFDNITFNLYVIQKRNVYYRVLNNDYRFPDDKLIASIKREQKKMKRDIEGGNKNKLLLRKYKKSKLMLMYIKYFDMYELYNSYLRVFYRYNPELANATFTCLKRSFIPHKQHLKPYYGLDELVKLGLNMNLISLPENTLYIDYRDALTDEELDKLCMGVQINDISAITLAQHQNYMIKEKTVGLLRYYTSQGAYELNGYLRGQMRYRYKNQQYEDVIYNMWKLILNAPAFDREYTLYRFIENDDYMSHIEVGDIYQDQGFMSTTRDPFYDVPSFGSILIKVRIPAKTKGVGLCLETMSLFPEEEEIILPPHTKLRLISRDDDCSFYGIRDVIIKKKYEFEWVDNTPDIDIEKNITNRPEYDLYPVNIMNSNTVFNNTTPFTRLERYINTLGQIPVTIGDKTFIMQINYYNSTGVYSHIYRHTTQDGMMLYCIYKGYILFTVEIGAIPNNGVNVIKIAVNWQMRYSEIDRTKFISDKDFIHLIAGIASNFHMPLVHIYGDTYSCNIGKLIDEESIKSKKSVLNSISNKDHMMSRTKRHNTDDIMNISISKNQQNHILRGMMGKHSEKIVRIGNRGIHRNQVLIGNYTQHKVDSVNSEQQGGATQTHSVYSIKYTGGDYVVDVYNYLKNGKKRYDDIDTINTTELYPYHKYYVLNESKTTSPSRILNIMDRDELYQIYVMSYLPLTKDDNNYKDTIADMYMWLVNTNCYMVNQFVNKIDRLYTKGRGNPYYIYSYVLDVSSYLYNRNITQYHGIMENYGYSSMVSYENEKKIKTLEMNRS